MLTILFPPVESFQGLLFFLGTQTWELRTLSGDSFPSDERRWILHPRGSICVLGRCAEAPPCSPISLLSSRFRSRAPLEVLVIQMDQRYKHTHTHTHTRTGVLSEGGPVLAACSVNREVLQPRQGHTGAAGRASFRPGPPPGAPTSPCVLLTGLEGWAPLHGVPINGMRRINNVFITHRRGSRK